MRYVWMCVEITVVLNYVQYELPKSLNYDQLEGDWPYEHLSTWALRIQVISSIHVYRGDNYPWGMTRESEVV
jgi:hypothetical protein